MRMNGQIQRNLGGGTPWAYAASTGVALLGIFLSVFVFIAMRGRELGRVRLDFQREAQNRVSALKLRVECCVDMVESTGSLFLADESVDRKEFENFVTPLLRQHPGIQALAWIQRVPDSQRTAFEEAARQDGYPDFQIEEKIEQGTLIRAARREEYFPVSYVEPYKGNQTALGYDLALDPVRREALNRARDSGQMTATEKLKLVTETGNQLGVLIINPVYRKGAPATTVDERRRNLVGFVLGVFRTGDTVEEALSRLAPVGVDVYVLDGRTLSMDNLLYFHPARTREPPVVPVDLAKALQSVPHHAAALDVAGREWTVVCAATPEFLAARTTRLPWGGLAGGLAVTGLIVACFLVVISRNARIERLARQLADANQEMQRDIRQRDEAEEAVRKSEEQYRTLVENVNVGVFRTTGGAQTGFIQANSALARMLGYDSVEEFVAVPVATLCEDPADLKHALDKIAREGFVRNEEFRAKRKDGTLLWASITAKAHYNANAELDWTDGVVQDITDRKRYEDQLAHLASHDPLTGLLNRRVFEDALKRAVAQARRGTASALMVLDMDHFKAVNDTLGHAAGDDVLVDVTRLIQERLREGDVLARLGGDEFAALLEEASLEDARDVAERVRQGVEGFFLASGLRVHPTLSAGLAAIDGQHEIEAVMFQADAAMYKAKEDGRNRVMCHHEGSPAQEVAARNARAAGAGLASGRS